MISYSLSMINSSGHEYTRLIGCEDNDSKSDSCEKKCKTTNRYQVFLFPELWQNVFKHLGLKGLGCVPSVCKAFETLSSSDQVWLHIRDNYLIDPLCHSIKLGVKDRLNFRIETEIYTFCDPSKAEGLCRFMREIFKGGIDKLAVDQGTCQVKLRAKGTFIINCPTALFKFYIPKNVTFKVIWQGLKFTPAAAPRQSTSRLPSSSYSLFRSDCSEWDLVDFDGERKIFKVQAFFLSSNPLYKLHYPINEQNFACESLYHLLPWSRGSKGL